MVVSDLTGVFPGEPGRVSGLDSSTAGIRWNGWRSPATSPTTGPRSSTPSPKYKAFVDDLGPYAKRLADPVGKAQDQAEAQTERLPVLHRQPFCVAFRIPGHPGTRSYELMAVNAHLYFGNYIDDRRHLQCPGRLDHEPVQDPEP